MTAVGTGAEDEIIDSIGVNPITLGLDEEGWEV